MRSSPAVLKSTHSERATGMITSYILHKFGCKPISSAPCASVSFPPPDELGLNFITQSWCFGQWMSFSNSADPREPSHCAWCTRSLRLQCLRFFLPLGRHEQGARAPVFGFLKQALWLFWHLGLCCFPAAALVLASLQMVPTLTRHSICTPLLNPRLRINIYNCMVYAVG